MTYIQYILESFFAIVLYIDPLVLQSCVDMFRTMKSRGCRVKNVSGWKFQIAKMSIVDVVRWRSSSEIQKKNVYIYLSILRDCLSDIERERLF